MDVMGVLRAGGVLCSQVLLVPVLHVHHPLLLHLLRHDCGGCGAQHPGGAMFPVLPLQIAVNARSSQLPHRLHGA